MVSWLEKKLLIMMGYIVGYLLLLWAYYVYIAPVWGYYGFLWEPNWGKIAEAMLWVATVSVILPVSFRRPSDFLLHLQFLLPILPMLVMFGAMDQPRLYLYAVLFSFGVLCLVSRIVRIKPVRTPKMRLRDLQTLLLLFGYGVVVSIVLQGGMRYFNLNLAKVYAYRGLAASNLPHLYGYINPWVSKVIFPFSLLLAVLSKEKAKATLSILGSVLMFGLTSHKGPLFYPLAVLLLYWLAGKRKGLILLLGGYYLSIFSSLVDYWFGIFHGWLATLAVRRVIFVPALLNFDYYDFFSQHGFVYWAQSKVTMGIIPYKFKLDISHLIGAYYFDNPGTGANTGWLGSGYANAGMLGMVMYAVIIGMIFSFLDAYTKFHDRRVIIAILVAPLLAVMVSSDLPTALLTHGTLVGLLLLSLFRTRSCTIKATGE